MTEKSEVDKIFEMFALSAKQFNEQQKNKKFTNKYFAESDLIKVNQTDLNMYQLTKELKKENKMEFTKQDPREVLFKGSDTTHNKEKFELELTYKKFKDPNSDYKNKEEAKLAAVWKNNQLTFLCPLDKKRCNKECLCYAPAIVYKEYPMDLTWLVSEVGCNNQMFHRKTI